MDDHEKRNRTWFANAGGVVQFAASCASSFASMVSAGGCAGSCLGGSMAHRCKHPGKDRTEPRIVRSTQKRGRGSRAQKMGRCRNTEVRTQPLRRLVLGIFKVLARGK